MGLEDGSVWENAETYGNDILKGNTLSTTLECIRLLLLANQDLQQMSGHLKSYITTISCFCAHFMIHIREHRLS